ncbi:MAG: indole-3-glycerol phosphate synthase TrpC [Kiritimatiellae bacterium]|jgi:indole-3-glycerol phosphate synthase|nr:indole-3-glycerol phosphate synthase TrpC [Kiritimatiellia bacterium]NLD89021.1 indole-3-glycerol phosphate synthase TrpC [Lentisphaerota bacterium]HOU22117.1 indole-3-glycerol phosphate synthase TrpC [Kiritimatiellia bacterium]
MSFLDQILSAKQAEIAAARRLRPQADLERLAAKRDDFRGFAASLARPGVRIIAEIKRASPSLGDIRPDLHPGDLAAAYQDGGAAALSVLTEPAFFKGSAQDLQRARHVTDLPVLRKDFILDPYQVYETAAMGADAMLLIVRILDDEQLASLTALAHGIGLETLVEIHDEADARRILDLIPPVVGINNRDLAHFRTDTTQAARLAALLPQGSAVVAASGIHSADDIQRALAAGIRRFLIGEILIRAPAPAALLSEWTALPVPNLLNS